jgi:hypothetical protein
MRLGTSRCQVKNGRTKRRKQTSIDHQYKIQLMQPVYIDPNLSLSPTNIPATPIKHNESRTC